VEELEVEELLEVKIPMAARQLDRTAGALA